MTGSPPPSPVGAPLPGQDEKAAACDDVKVTLRGPDGQVKQEVLA